MPLPMYQGLDAPQTISPGSMNLGLWFERFFSGFSDEFGKDEPARSAWLRQFDRKPSGKAAELQAKAEKIAQLATSQGGQTRIYHCPGSFVTGTGNPHPLENGFLWHPTLGTPYLPGSAVKGLVRALVETAYGGDDRDDVLKRWFGTVKKDDVAEQSGQFIFLDALPIAPCELFVDVMTPHMGKWYEKGGKTPLAKDTQPGDWHSPVPVSYLTTRNLKLQFAILPRPRMEADVVQQELANLWLALDKALEWPGAGAKTAIGFGAMQVDQSALKRRAQEAADQKAQEERKEAERQRQAELESMSPVDRAINECLDARLDKNMADIPALKNAIKAGQWQGDLKRDIALRLREMLQTANKWKEASTKKNPAKDNDYQDTLLVKAWISGQ